MLKEENTKIHKDSQRFTKIHKVLSHSNPNLIFLTQEGSSDSEQAKQSLHK